MGNCAGAGQQDSRGPNGLRIKGGNAKGSVIQNRISECKVVIIGDSSVGKTSIAVRYLKNDFTEAHVVTIGVLFQQPSIKLQNGNILRLNLWDTAGEERFESMVQIYYRDAKAAVLVYDIGSRTSFNHIEKWLKALDKNVAKEDMVIYLVGNKKDLGDDEKKVETDTAQKFARQNGMLFSELSAKTGEGITDVFKNLAEELAKKHNY